MDRDIQRINQSQQLTKKQIQQLAKKGDLKSSRLLAKEVCNSRKAVNRLITSKAHLNSLSMQLGEIAGTHIIIL